MTEAWAKSCDKYVFVAKLAPSIQNKVEFMSNYSILEPEGLEIDSYAKLSTKVLASFATVYSKYINDYDWFLKCDDDSFIFVENMKIFLKDQNSSDPVTFGCNFKPYVTGGYHSGGGGYVLSREALSRFGPKIVADKKFCANSGIEDIDIAKCLRKLDVKAGVSIDELKRERFHPLSIDHHLKGHYAEWIYGYVQNPLKKVRTITNHHLFKTILCNFHSMIICN